MSTALALVDTVPSIISSLWLIDEVNRLESAIALPHGQANELFWRQAEYISTLAENGWSLRRIAARWMKRDGKTPHSYSLVNWTLQVFKKLNSVRPRPDFLEERNKIANKSKSRWCWGNGDDEWYTDPKYVEAARTVLGSIDLDPASCLVASKEVRAAKFFSIEDDALTKHWSGRVWLNPPYSEDKIGPFIDKLIAHVVTEDVTAAVVLTMGSTNVEWFQKLYEHAAAVCLPKGRLTFWKPDNDKRKPAPFASAFFYFGPDVQKFREQFAEFGVVR